MQGLRISVGLLDFFRTGRFDCLRLGQSQELILHNFPDPDDVGPKGRDAPLTIWRYGNVELHFADHQLHMVFSDYVSTLDGGPSISLDPWALGEPAGRTLAAMMRALTAEKIDFAKRTTPIGQVELLLASGVCLTFDDGESGTGEPRDPNDIPLVAFALQRRSATHE